MQPGPELDLERAQDPEQAQVAASRRRVEQRLVDLRQTVHETTGIVPRGTAWVLPAVGFAVGFSFAVRAWRRRQRRRRLAG
jgi:hypothetical protein